MPNVKGWWALGGGKVDSGQMTDDSGDRWALIVVRKQETFLFPFNHFELSC